MRYNEIKCDLFSLGPEYYLAHCISADFALGAGIAVQFNRRFDLHKKLKAEYPRYANYWNGGTCLLEDRVFNLVLSCDAMVLLFCWTAVRVPS